jgi:hypothetical protein
MKSTAQDRISPANAALFYPLWTRRALLLDGLIVLTFVAGGVVAAILPLILANAFQVPAESISLDLTTAAMFLLFSLLRALLAARLVDHELTPNVIVRWVLLSVGVEFGVLFALASLIPLLPLPFITPLAERLWAMSCAVIGGILVGVLQRRLFDPQPRGSVLWVAASATGWLLAIALTTAVA